MNKPLTDNQIKGVIAIAVGGVILGFLMSIEPKPYTDAHDICQAAHINAGYSSNDTNAYCSF